LVEGNYIGTDVTGTQPLGNKALGVVIGAIASNNTVGGTVAGAGNLISANGIHGVYIDGSNNVGTTANVVQGNFIGTDVSGALALGNAEDGVYIRDATNNTVGGTTAGAGNVIASNGVSG